MNTKDVAIKLLKIVLAVILGLALSLFTIVCLEIVLPKPNPFQKQHVNFWFFAPIIAAWLFVCLWYALRNPSATKNIQTQGIEQLPDSATELIDAIIESMRFRKCDRADVRQELTDHFTDVMKECRDEQEKKTQIVELITEFGDAQLLGALIRRGKKRCQPLWRKALTHTPHAIGISILLLIVYIAWFFTGKPNASIDYLTIWNQQIRPTVDDSANAKPFYSQAAEKYSDDALKAWKEKTEKDFRKSPIPLSSLSSEENNTLNQWIQANIEAIDLVRKGTTKPYYWEEYSTGDPESTEAIAVLLPHLNEYKNLAYLLCWQSLYTTRDKQWNQAFDSCITTYKFGSHIRQGKKTLVEQLVGLAIQNLATETIHNILYENSDNINLESLHTAKEKLSQIIDEQDFTIDFSCERFFIQDETQRCFTQSRFGKSHLYLPRLHELGGQRSVFEDDKLAQKAFYILFTHPGKEETLQMIDTFYNKMEMLAHQTPATQHASGYSASQITEEMIKENILLDIMLPALGRITELSYRNHVNSDATLIVLAAFEYQKSYGDFPNSLKQLTEKQLLKEIPIDPFSNQPIVYKKTDTQFILYSIGSNFTDNGGRSGTNHKQKPSRWSDNGDWIFWPENWESLTKL